MRDALKGLSENDYWCYGVDEGSLDHCFNMVKSFIQYQQGHLQDEYAKVRLREPNPDIHGEIISDLAHYGWCDEQVLWQLALWRCQGIFEAMLKYAFLKKKPNHKLWACWKAR